MDSLKWNSILYWIFTEKFPNTQAVKVRFRMLTYSLLTLCGSPPNPDNPKEHSFALRATIFFQYEPFLSLHILLKMSKNGEERGKRGTRGGGKGSDRLFQQRDPWLTHLLWNRTSIWMCERDRERHTCTETEMLADSISFCQLSVVTRPKLHFTNFIPSWLGRNSAETSQQDLFSVSFKSSLQTQICHFFFPK